VVVVGGVVVVVDVVGTSTDELVVARRAAIEVEGWLDPSAQADRIKPSTRANVMVFPRVRFASFTGPKYCHPGRSRTSTDTSSDSTDILFTWTSDK